MLEPFDAAVAALLVGLGGGALAAGHCAAMCGPLAALAGGGGAGARSIGWLAGRATAYALLGAIAGGTSGALGMLGDRFGSVISIVLAATMLVASWTWLREPGPGPIAIGSAPRSRSPFSWALHRALAHRAAPPVLGAATALLPCGALWAAIASAIATGSAIGGAMAMVGFSIASAPGLLLSGWLAGHADVRGRRLIGGAMVLGALVLLLRPAIVSPAEGASCHDDPGMSEVSR